MIEAIDHSAEPLLNVGELLSRVDNDKELVRELLQLFKQECPRLMQSLHDAVSKKEMKAVQTTSHSLKGMLANLSATRATAAASRLEEISNGEEHSRLRAALAALESEIALLIPELDACLMNPQL